MNPEEDNGWYKNSKSNKQSVAKYSQQTDQREKPSMDGSENYW